jgi:hypothetical protein
VLLRQLLPSRGFSGWASQPRMSIKLEALFAQIRLTGVQLRKGVVGMTRRRPPCAGLYEPTREAAMAAFAKSWRREA